MSARTEPLDEFRRRVRAWLRAEMPPLPAEGYPYNPMASSPEERFARARALQRKLFDGGLAGLTFPTDAGGHGRPYPYQAVLVEESAPYEMPLRFTMPTLGIIAATILDVGTPEQRARYIPPMLRGDHLWVQLLSEPSCGSDLAGVRTRAERDGETWRIDGEKVWSSAAYGCDWGICLARTDWTVPKHAGLTMFAIDLANPRVEIRPIRQVDGSEEFCAVHLDGVEVPAADVIGPVNGGWSVATTLMSHERDSVGGGSAYIGNVHIHGGRGSGRRPVRPTSTSQLDPRHARDLVGAAHVEATVGDHLVDRIGRAVALGVISGPSGALLKLYRGTNTMHEATAAVDLAGMSAVVWDDHTDDRDVGIRYLRRQANSLAGGSNEMQRNLISERLLGMPREAAPDRGRPFQDVPASRRDEAGSRP